MLFFTIFQRMRMLLACCLFVGLSSSHGLEAMNQGFSLMNLFNGIKTTAETINNGFKQINELEVVKNTKHQIGNGFKKIGEGLDNGVKLVKETGEKAVQGVKNVAENKEVQDKFKKGTNDLAIMVGLGDKNEKDKQEKLEKIEKIKKEKEKIEKYIKQLQHEKNLPDEEWMKKKLLKDKQLEKQKKIECEEEADKIQKTFGDDLYGISNISTYQEIIKNNTKCNIDEIDQETEKLYKQVRGYKYFTPNSNLQVQKNQKEELQKIVMKKAEELENQIKDEERELDRLEKLGQDTEKLKEKYNTLLKQKEKIVEDEIKEEMKKIEKLEKQEEKLTNEVAFIAEEQHKFVAQKQKNQEELKTLEKKTKIELDFKKQTADTETVKFVASTKKAIQTIFENLKDPKLLMRIGATILIVIVLIIVAYFAFSLLYTYLNKKLQQPRLIRDSSLDKRTVTQHILSYIKMLLGYAAINNKEHVSDKVILPADLLKRNFEQKMKIIAERDLPQRHFLVTGPPGTGKTLLATTMAQTLGWDWFYISGSDLLQDPDNAVQTLNEFLYWVKGDNRLASMLGQAPKSKKVMVIIDECDAFCGLRSTLSEAGRQALLAFLTASGGIETKISYWFLTNAGDKGIGTQLDPAILSRVSEHIHFKLPPQEDRKKIMKMYIDKFFVNETYHGKNAAGYAQDIKLLIDKDIDEAYYNNLAGRLEGFCGREIKDLIAGLVADVQLLDNYTLTKEIFEQAIAIAIEKHEKGDLLAQGATNLSGIGKSSTSPVAIAAH